MRKVHELRSKGVTILFVSHAVGDVKAIGDAALWLDHGAVVDVGAPDRVVSRYLAAMSAKDSTYRLHEAEAHRAAALELPEPSTAPEVVRAIPNIDHRHGDGRAEILGISVLDESGNPARMLEPQSRIVVRISVRAKDSLMMPNVGFTLRNQLGIDFAASNTLREGHELAPMHSGDIVTVDFHLELPALYPAAFSFSPAVADGALEDYRMCDWIDNAISLQMMRSGEEIYGYIHLPCRVEVNARLGVAEMEGHRA
jgi:hypothetical protein